MDSVETYIPYKPRQHGGCYEDSHEFKENTTEAEKLWYNSGVCYVFENVEVVG